MQPYFLKIALVVSFLCLNCTTKEQTGGIKPVEAESMLDLKLLADSCYSVDNYKSAVRYYSELIDFGDSLNGELYYKRGYSFGRIEDFEKSSSDLKKAIAFKYREADAYYILGLNATMVLDMSSAELYLSNALEINPQKQEALLLLKSVREELHRKDKSL